MKIVLITHPSTLHSTSMPRIVEQLFLGMQHRGHDVVQWTSPIIFSRIGAAPYMLKKWLGYVDQFLIYPAILASKVFNSPKETIFVVTDQALGIWVPRIAHRPHVIHCNDFLAIRSALDEFSQNPTSSTGKIYQSLILRGLKTARNFISISYATETDLKRLVKSNPDHSHVSYLGLNKVFGLLNAITARQTLGETLTQSDERGFLLHVGGNQWYKNRIGVLELYAAWCRRTTNPIPLWIIGAPPTETNKKLAASISNGGCVRFLSGLSDEKVVAAYNLCKIFLFPSLEEGFGWPIVEGLACGTLVVTTDAAPMNEVGGDAVTYLPRKHKNNPQWAEQGAVVLQSLVELSPDERAARIKRGIEHASQFDLEKTLDRYEEIYKRVLAKSQHS